MTTEHQPSAESDVWPPSLAAGNLAYAKCVRVAWETGAANNKLAELRRSFADLTRAEAPGTRTLSEREAVLRGALRNAAERIEPKPDGLQRIRARLRHSPGPWKQNRPPSYRARLRRP
jgi:hypothetical protein